MIKVLSLCVVAIAYAAESNADRRRMVDEINSLTDKWVAGFSPRFSNGNSMVDLLGVYETNLEDIQAGVNAGEIDLVDFDPSLGPIPDSFDSEKNWPECAAIIGDIRDQSNCGCCWAFGTASAASDRYCIATGGADQVTFSAQDVCFCASWNGCGGGFTRTAFNHIQSGVVSGGQYNDTGPVQDLCSAYSLPHCHHHGPQGDDPYPAEGEPGCPSQRSPACPRKCDANAQAPHNVFSDDKYSFSGRINSYTSVEAIQQAIMTGGPVATAFTVYADFENYVSGVYHHVTGSSLGGHAVRFVGWGVDGGTKYWKVANSWNPYWGEQGYFRIQRGTDEGGIESQAIAPANDVAWKNPHA